LKTLDFCGFIPFLQENSKRWDKQIYFCRAYKGHKYLSTRFGLHLAKNAVPLRKAYGINAVILCWHYYDLAFFISVEPFIIRSIFPDIPHPKKGYYQG
jgi:hypothetical protein